MAGIKDFPEDIQSLICSQIQKLDEYLNLPYNLTKSRNEALH
jgi:hypothetical protein